MSLRSSETLNWMFGLFLAWEIYWLRFSHILHHKFGNIGTFELSQGHRFELFLHLLRNTIELWWLENALIGAKAHLWVNLYDFRIDTLRILYSNVYFHFAVIILNNVCYLRKANLRAPHCILGHSSIAHFSIALLVWDFLRRVKVVSLT